MKSIDDIEKYVKEIDKKYMDLPNNENTRNIIKEDITNFLSSIESKYSEIESVTVRCDKTNNNLGYKSKYVEIFFTSREAIYIHYHLSFYLF